jgi:hypothetical protein
VLQTRRSRSISSRPGWFVAQCSSEYSQLPFLSFFPPLCITNQEQPQQQLSLLISGFGCCLLDRADFSSENFLSL